MSRAIDNYNGVFVTGIELELLVHARALEAMLRKHEFNGNPEPCTGVCPECRRPEPLLDDAEAHSPDCELAKLLEEEV